MSDESKNQLFEQLFPIPLDRAHRKLQFGTLPGVSELPIPGLQHSNAVAPPPFRMEWDDPELGLWFTVDERLEKGGRSGELVASVDAKMTTYAGRTVSLGLVGTESGNQICRLIPLVANQSGGCSGEGSFGSLEDLYRALGHAIQPTYFLFE